MREEIKTQSREKNWIIVYILYGNPPAKEFSFNVHFNLRRVLEEAIRVFGLQPPMENYQLFYNDKQLSDLNKSLQHYGIVDEAQLVMAHVHVVG